MDTRCTLSDGNIIKIIYSYLVQRKWGANKWGGTSSRKFELEAPRVRNPRMRNDRFLDDVQKSPLRKWRSLGLCIYLLQLVALVGGGWTFSSWHVTMIRLYILKSSIMREVHSVGLEVGVSSYEVELHINNRWYDRDMWQLSTCTYWNRPKMFFLVIPHMGFFEAVVDTHCVRDEWASYS